MAAREHRLFVETGAQRGNNRATVGERRWTMAQYALVSVVVALIAALFGFLGVAVDGVEAAEILFFVFFAMFVASILAGVVPRDRAVQQEK